MRYGGLRCICDLDCRLLRVFHSNLSSGPDWQISRWYVRRTSRTLDSTAVLRAKSPGNRDHHCSYVARDAAISSIVDPAEEPLRLASREAKLAGEM